MHALLSDGRHRRAQLHGIFKTQVLSDPLHHDIDGPIVVHDGELPQKITHKGAQVVSNMPLQITISYTFSLSKTFRTSTFMKLHLIQPHVGLFRIHLRCFRTHVSHALARAEGGAIVHSVAAAQLFLHVIGDSRVTIELVLLFIARIERRYVCPVSDDSIPPFLSASPQSENIVARE